MTDEVVLTVREVASRLRVSEWTVADWLRTGRLRGYRVGGKRAGWRIREADLNQYVAERQAASRPIENHSQET